MRKVELFREGLPERNIIPTQMEDIQKAHAGIFDGRLD